MKISNQKALVESFYQAFARKDAYAMGQLYSNEARFSDNVFLDLNASQVSAMWSMLCSRSKDLVVSFQIIDEFENEVHTVWQADYTFTKTGRKVHNVINSRMKIKNDKIYSHIDSFSFWKWSSQALGPIGILLGWTPFIKRKVQKDAMNSLKKFCEASIPK